VPSHVPRLLQGREPFVAFVGAGASALPPSNLPTWNEFNDLLLQSLGDSVAAYSSNRQPTGQIVAAFRSRRENELFSPDFQAQLMEDEIGADYFRVWQSLDTDAFGPVHAALAQLAGRGRLAAVVTTNFDRLIESALAAAGHPFEVVYDEATFAALTPFGSDPPAALPVLKIHGSLEHTASLVDTLKQRVVGRPEPVMQTLRALLLAHPWLFLGISGADFTYNPRYLGVLDVAGDAKGFVFLAREGSKVADGVVRLQEAYGEPRAAIVHGELEPWLARTFDLDLPVTERPAAREETIARVRERIGDWVGTLGPMASVNILYSLLRSASLDGDAFWLMRKTWKSYRSPDDTEGRAYYRYNYNFGRALFDAGLVARESPAEEDADQGAFQYLWRGYALGNLLAAGGLLASVHAYRGELDEALALAAKVNQEALLAGNPLDICDVALAIAVIYDIVTLDLGADRKLAECVTLAEKIGDEPRRAMLLAQLARFLTYGGRFAEAKEALDEALRIGTRIGLRPVLLAVRATLGRWLSDSQTSHQLAIRILEDVRSVLHAQEAQPLVARYDMSRPDQEPTVLKNRSPLICRVLLDLNRAAMYAGNTDVMHSALVELDKLVDAAFYGYSPHFSLARAESLMRYGDDNGRALVPSLIDEARQLGEATSNAWAAAAADALERRLSP
jgi:NAD-dependent SIR2 family protein deacetylase/tetratricopeptide (TPR) repeat protein